jgi:phage gp29-like protein
MEVKMALFGRKNKKEEAIEYNEKVAAEFARDQKPNLMEAEFAIKDGLYVDGVNGFTAPNFTPNTVDEMLIDEDISSALVSRRYGLLKRDWTIKAVNALDDVTVVKNLLKDVNIPLAVENIFEAQYYGYCAIEIMWDIENQTIKELKKKPWWWFKYNRKDGWKFDTKPVPERKFLFPVYQGTIDAPLGKSILEPLNTVFALKNTTAETWGKFLKKYGMPWIIYNYDGNMMKDAKKKEELRATLKVLRSAIENLTIALPKQPGATTDDTLKFQDMSKLGSEVYEKLAMFCEKKISRSILGGTLTQDVTEKGTYAAAKVHADVKEEFVFYDSLFIREAFQPLINWLGELHGFDGKNYYLAFEDIDTDPLKKNQAERDVLLSGMGVNFSVKYYAETYGIPESEITVVDKNMSNAENVKKITRKNPSTAGENVGTTSVADTQKNGTPSSFSEFAQEILIDEEDNDFWEQFDSKMEALNLDDWIENDFGKSNDKNTVVYALMFATAVYGFLNANNIKVVTKLSTDKVSFVSGIINEVPSIFDKLEEIEAIAEKAYNNFYTQLTMRAGTLEKEELLLGGYIGENPYNLRAIVDTSANIAYNKARYDAQIEVIEERPIWFLDVTMDDRTSRICQLLYGLAFEATDPIWSTIYPPNHTYCRTRVIAMSRARAKELGIKIANTEVITNAEYYKKWVTSSFATNLSVN